MITCFIAGEEGGILSFMNSPSLNDLVTSTIFSQQQLAEIVSSMNILIDNQQKSVCWNFVEAFGDSATIFL
jgi:hypothetical protein